MTYILLLVKFLNTSNTLKKSKVSTQPCLEEKNNKQTNKQTKKSLNSLNLSENNQKFSKNKLVFCIRLSSKICARSAQNQKKSNTSCSLSIFCKSLLTYLPRARDGTQRQNIYLPRTHGSLGSIPCTTRKARLIKHCAKPTYQVRTDCI